VVALVRVRSVDRRGGAQSCRAAGPGCLGRSGRAGGDGGIGWFVSAPCGIVPLWPGRDGQSQQPLLAAGIVALASLLAAAAQGFSASAGACAAVFPACIAVRMQATVVEGRPVTAAASCCCTLVALCARLPCSRGVAHARASASGREGRALDLGGAITPFCLVLSRASLAWPRLSVQAVGRIVAIRPSHRAADSRALGAGFQFVAWNEVLVVVELALATLVMRCLRRSAVASRQWLRVALLLAAGAGSCDCAGGQRIRASAQAPRPMPGSPVSWWPWPAHLRL